ncbi:MAG: signal recognition particle receptor subunit alpha [Candidatus Diapherotrites archaeon]
MDLGESLRNALEKLRNSSKIDKETVKETIKQIQRALISADVEIALVIKLSKEIEQEAFKDLPENINRKEHVIKTTYEKLVEILGEKTSPPEDPKKILLVGLFGNGKTTTAGKLAKWYQKRGKKTGLIAADVFRPAATEQLRTIAKNAKAEFYGNEKEKDPKKIIKEGLQKLKDCDLIICDSAGRSALDEELIKEIKEINNEFQAEHKWLVIGADIGQLAKKQAQAFHEAIGINGVILTRTDGSAKGGGALAACKATGAKVYFIGTGEKIDDIQEFDSTRYLSRIMGYGDLQTLIEKATEIQEEIEEINMTQNDFTLQTFYTQLKATKKIGPLTKIMELMGLSRSIPKEIAEIGEKKLRDYGNIIDSMTPYERQHAEMLNKSRIARIAKGSGKTQESVRELLSNFKKMKKMYKELTKATSQENIRENNLEALQKKVLGAMKKKKKFKLR